MNNVFHWKKSYSISRLSNELLRSLGDSSEQSEFRDEDAVCSIVESVFLVNVVDDVVIE